MKAVKVSELKSKTVAELEAMVLEEKASLFKTRRDMAFRQTSDTAGYKTRRHNIARMLTLITEKKGAENA